MFQHVRILDLNDNKPEFLQDSYQFFIEENIWNISLSHPSIEVYDLDILERNSNLTYQIVNRLHSLSDYSMISSSRSSIEFPVAIQEYVIVLNTEDNHPLLHIVKPFDFEIYGGRIEFELIANDIDNMTDSCHITIVIIDINDNSPVFLNENTTFVIKENSPPNSFIGQVSRKLF